MILPWRTERSAGGRILRVLAPGVLGPLASKPPSGVFPRLPSLEHVLARGDRSVAAAEAPSPEPAGPLSWMGEGGVVGDGYWSRATPVFLQAEGSGVRLQQPPMEAPELERLAETVGDVAAGHGIELHRAGTRWYLRSAAPAPSRPPPAQLAGRFVDGRVPRDPDALAWARLLSELELTLYDHPINQRRQEQGQAPINSLWIWGCGQLERRPPRCEWDCIHADDPAWWGFARWAGTAWAPLSDVKHLLDEGAPEAGSRVLVVEHRLADALAAGDGEGWLEGVRRLEKDILAPTLEVLKGARGASWWAMELDAGDGTGVVRFRPWHRLRVWRRETPWEGHARVTETSPQ